MKKIVFSLLLVGIMLFAGCSSDKEAPTPPKRPTHPIEELEMPSPDILIESGSTVTIKGWGFTSKSQIWLRRESGSNIREKMTEIVEVTGSQISFVAPEDMDGELEVLLIEGDKQYPLGKIWLVREPLHSIEGLEFPPSDVPIAGGLKTTIFGKGFTENSILWIRENDHSQANNSPIKLLIVGVTNTYITFIAPKHIVGEWTLYLEIDSKLHPLGTLIFHKERSIEEDLYALRLYKSENLFKLSWIKGDKMVELHTIGNMSEAEEIVGVTTVGTKAYFVSTKTTNSGTKQERREFERLICYDTEEYTLTNLPIATASPKGEVVAFGTIMYHLYMFRYNQAKGALTLLSLDEAGAERVIKEYVISECKGLRFEEDNYIFVYDKADDWMILMGKLKGEDYAREITLPFNSVHTNGIIKEILHLDKTFFIAADDAVFQFRHNTLHNTQGTYMFPYNSVAREIRPSSTFIESLVSKPCYMPVSDVLYFINDKSELLRTDIKAGATRYYWPFPEGNHPDALLFAIARYK